MIRWLDTVNEFYSDFNDAGISIIATSVAFDLDENGEFCTESLQNQSMTIGIGVIVRINTTLSEVYNAVEAAVDKSIFSKCNVKIDIKSKHFKKFNHAGNGYKINLNFNISSLLQ